MPFPALLERAALGTADNPESLLCEILTEQGVRLVDLPAGINTPNSWQKCAGVLLYRGNAPTIAIPLSLRPEKRLLIGTKLLQAFLRYPPGEMVARRLRRKGARFIVASCHQSKLGYRIEVHQELIAE